MELDTAMGNELKENGIWVPLTPAKSVQGHASVDSEKEGDNSDGLFGNWNSSSVLFEEKKHCAAKDLSAGIANNFSVVGSGNSGSGLEFLGLHQTSKGITGRMSDNIVFQETAKVEVPPAWIRGIELQNEHTQYNVGLNSSTVKASDAQKNQNPMELDTAMVKESKENCVWVPLTPAKSVQGHAAADSDKEGDNSDGLFGKTGGMSDNIVFQEAAKVKVPPAWIRGIELQNEHTQYNVGVNSSTAKSSDAQKNQNPKKRSNPGVSLNKKKRPKMKRHRPKIFDASKPKKTPKSKVNPSTPKQKTPKRCIPSKSQGQRNKCGRTTEEREVTGESPGCAINSCRQRLDFNRENQVRDNVGVDEGRADSKVMELSTQNDDFARVPANFLELQDFDLSSRTRTITLQYRRRKKSLNNSVLEEELNGDKTINKSNADSKLQSSCRSINLPDCKRILRSNKCLRNSRKIGPNWPKIYNKKRTKRQRATVFHSLFYRTVACDKKVDRCIRQEATPQSVSAAHTNVEKKIKRHLPLKFCRQRSQKRARKCELFSNSTMEKDHVNVILPTERQRLEAMADPASFKCVRSLCPMVSFRKKRSWVLNQKRRHWDAHLSNEKETKESTILPKLHESALILTQFVKAEGKRPMTSTPRRNTSSFCKNANQDDEQEKLEVHIEDTQHLNVQCLNEIPYSEGRHLNQNNILSSQNEDAYDIDFVTQKLESLLIDDGCNQLVVRDKKVHGALLPYKGKFDPSKRRKPLPKINLDAETMRVWKLLMENDGSEGIEEVDADKEKWWENEREVFRGRIDSFISCMHLIQGDRRFSPWKGSVVDSVVGVFLTQNVSDHLSSSAFMSLAARFPPSFVTNQNANKNTTSSQESVDSNKADCGRSTDGNIEQPCFCSTEKDLGKSCISPTTKSLGGDAIICEDAVEGIPDSSSHVNSNTTSRSCNSEDSAMYRELLEVEENEFLQQFYGPEEKKMSGVESTSDKKFGDSQSTTRAFGSDKTSDSDGKAASCSPQSVNLMGDLGNINIKDSCDIGKNHESTEGRDSCDIGKNHESTEGRDSCDIGKKQESTEGRKKRQVKDKQENPVNWDELRKTYSCGRSKDTINSNIDSVNWEAVRQSTVQEVAKAIMERGMNNILAGRIKDFLDRMVQDHGIIDLEWLRDVPPDKTKNYLLSITGLGLKSTECVRLLTLQHHAFPVDTNVGRILVRLGWVPLLPLPEDIQIHLLNQYPLVDTIQKYIWPRLCTFKTQTLYELHYQMITFGKVFCTKIRPNCNACPMRGQCKHFASAYASAKLRLQGSSEESKNSEVQVTSSQDPIDTSPPLLVHYDGDFSVCNKSYNSGPFIEYPQSPEPASRELLESDIEDFGYQSEDEIPTIKINNEEFAKNILDFMEKTSFSSGESAVSKELVVLSPEAASIPMPKLKSVSRLRTIHQVYELPDSHPLLAGFEKREPDDPCPYLLAIWITDETANSSQLPGKTCNGQESTTCDMDACCSADTGEKQIDELIQGTILIPCRTANRGSFPLNGTYFQVNEVFADHESSRCPIAVPRKWIWNLRRRALYCGTSTTSIFKGFSTDEIQYCFWRGFICVRGMDRVTRAARPLARRFHICKTRLVDEE